MFHAPGLALPLGELSNKVRLRGYFVLNHCLVTGLLRCADKVGAFSAYS